MRAPPTAEPMFGKPTKLLFSFLCASIFGLVAFAFFNFYQFSDTRVSAQGAAGDIPLIGWAWSSNVGFIHFDPSCASGSCGGVFLQTDGDLVGYAWVNPQYDDGTNRSNNIGYIRFDPPGPYPGGPGTTDTSAQLIGNNLQGWARACSVFVNGCGGPMSDTDLKTDDKRGGWDGWVSLRGQSDCSGVIEPPPCRAGESYGVVRDGINLRDYAWGGDVFGWIQFDPLCDQRPPGNPDGVGETPCDMGVTIGRGFDYTLTVLPLTQTVTSADSASIRVSFVHNGIGSLQTLTFNIEDVPVGITPSIPDSQCAPADFSGTTCIRMVRFPPLPLGTYTMKVVALSPSREETFDIIVGAPILNPRVDLKANNMDGPITVVQGQGVSLTWTSTNVPPLGGGSCELYDGGATPYRGGLGTDGRSTLSGVMLSSSRNSRTYRIVCDYTGTLPGQSNSDEDSVIINIQRRGFRDF